MEIPTLKLKQYERNQKKFAHELGETLEDIGVAQVDGLDQQLVDDLYGYMQEHTDDFRTLYSESLGKHFRKQELLGEHGLKSSSLRRIPYLNYLVKGIRKNVSGITSKVTYAIASLYGPLVKSQDLILFRYYKKQGLHFSNEKNMIKQHTDDKSPLTFAPSASAPGLEGKINGRWTRLQPQRGYLLVWPGDDLESISDGKIKALLHRVQHPTTERWALIYG